jgi:hypothetical protein
MPITPIEATNHFPFVLCAVVIFNNTYRNAATNAAESRTAPAIRDVAIST